MICNGKVECVNDVDEFKCMENTNYEYDEKKIREDILDKSQLPSAKRLTSIQTITPFKVNINYASFSKSSFSLTYSLDVDRTSQATMIYRQQVGVYRVREDRDLTDVDDSIIQSRGESVSVFEYDSYRIGTERTIEVGNLQPGYVYVCVFFVNLDGTRFKTYKLADRLVFTQSGFITPRAHFKSTQAERNIKMALIAAVALLALISFVLFTILLFRCCLSRRRQRRLRAAAATAGMKYKQISPELSSSPSSRRMIFSPRSVVAAENQIPLANNAFIEDGVYNSPNV